MQPLAGAGRESRGPWRSMSPSRSGSIRTDGRGTGTRLTPLRLFAVALLLAPLPLVAAVLSAGTPSRRAACLGSSSPLGRRPLCRRAWDHDVDRDRRRARLVARRARDRLRPPAARRAVDQPLRDPPRRRPASAASPADVQRRVAPRLEAATAGGSPTPRALWPAGASTSGRSHRGAVARRWLPRARPSKSRPPSTATARSTFRTLQPGDAFPEKRATRARRSSALVELLPDFDQRAPFRLTIAGTRARLRLRDRQRRRRADLGSRQLPVPPGRWSRSQLVRLPTGRCGGTTTRGAALHPGVDPLALAPARLPALRAAHARRRPRRPRPQERLLPRRPLRPRPPAGARLHGGALPRQLRCVAAGRLPSSRAPRPGSPTSIRPTSTARTSSSAACGPAIYLLVHRANPQGRLEELDYEEQRRLAPDQADVARRHAARRDAAHLRRLSRLLASDRARPEREQIGSRSAAGVAVVAVEQEGCHAERPGALDVVLV